MSKTKDAGPAPEITEPATNNTARRGLDPELQAMAKIDRILSDLDGEETSRVIGWLHSRNSRKMYGFAEPGILMDQGSSLDPAK